MLAILSNTNSDPIIRRVKKSIPCLESTGYGNIFEALFNPASQVLTQKADIVLLLIDLREYIGMFHTCDDAIEEFFANLEQAIRPGCQYFISDAVYYLPTEISYSGDSETRRAEYLWDASLYQLCQKNRQCKVFPLRQIVQEIGTQAFYSEKSWCLGSVRYSMEGIKGICQEIERAVKTAQDGCKKALLIDLDNTLWGGVAGEDGINGILLADSGSGRCYKEFQMQIRRLKEAGTILSIVSKNNEDDAWEVIDKHPHMLLHREDFAAFRINWESKAANIRSLTEELNIGLDSVVFVDDNPVECSEVSSTLPQVTVLQFPNRPEEIRPFFDSMVRTYFRKLTVTDEDKQKTEQYQAKKRVEEAKKNTVDFSGFLDSLHIRVIRKNHKEHMERLLQLVQKTNQFNTTVTRYSQAELEGMVEDQNWDIFLYEIQDVYANHGLCAAAFVRLSEEAVIENFLMSCRVMGRNIEYGILDDIQQTIKSRGIQELKAVFRRGPKNMPVESLYERAGYSLLEDDEKEKKYRKTSDSTERFIGEVDSEL